MGSILRKTGRYAAWALVVVAAIVVLALLVLQTPWAKNRLRHEIVTRANEALEGEISIDRISGTLISSATIEGVGLQDGRGRPLGRISRVYADYSLLSLLWGRLDVERVEIDEPRIILRRYEDGTLNVETLVAQTEQEPRVEPSEFEVHVENYRIEDGQLVWADEGMIGERFDSPDAVSTAVDRVVESGSPDAESGPAERLRAELRGAPPTPRQAPAVALVDRLDLRGSIHILGTTALRGRLERLSARIDTDTLPRSLRATLQGLGARYATNSADVSLESFELADDLRLTGLHASTRLRREPSGEMRPGPYHAKLDELRVEKSLANEFLPAGELQVDVATEIEIGGDLDRTWFQTRTALGDAGVVTTSGHAGLSKGVPEYDASVRITKLRTEKIGDFGQPPAELEAAVDLRGRGIDPKTANTRLRAAVWSSAVSSVRIRRLYTRASLDEGLLSLERFALDSSHLTARVQAAAGLDGRYTIRARTRTPDRTMSTDQLGLDDVPPIEVGRADIELAASGRLDPEAETTFGVLDRSDVRAKWRLADIDGFGLRIGRSEGEVDGAFSPPRDDSEATSRQLELDATSSGRSIRLPGIRIGSYRIDGRANGRLAFPPSEPARAVRELSSHWRGEVSGIGLNNLSIDAARFETSVRAAGGEGAFRGEAKASADGIAAGSARIDSARADLSGSVRIGGETLPELQQFSAEGTADASRIDGPSFGIASVSSSFDLRGRPEEPQGTVRANTGTIEIAGRTFTGAELEVDAKSGRSIRTSLEVVPEPTPDRPYRLLASASFGRQLEVVTLSKLRLGRRGQMWRLTREATIELLPNGVRVRTLELKNGDQRIFVDGVYRTVGGQSLTLEMERIDLQGLQDLAATELVPGLRGRFGLQVELGGTAAEPTVDLEANGEELGALGYGPGSFDTRIRSSGGSVDLEQFVGRHADRRLLELTAHLPLDWNLSGDWSFDERAESRFEATLETVEISRLESAAPPVKQFPVEGTVGGHFEFRGTLDQPNIDSNFHVEKLSIHGDIAGMRVDIDDLTSTTRLHYGGRSSDKKHIELHSDLTWKAADVISVMLETDAPLVQWGRDYLDGEISLDTLTYRVASEQLQFSIRFEETDLREVPLEPLKAADAEGTLSAKFSVEGTLLSPEAEGRLDLDDFGWSQYRDVFVDMQMRLRDEEFELEKFRVEWDAKEVVTAYGTLPLPIRKIVEGKPLDALPLDFTIQVAKTPLVRFGAIDNAFNRFRGSVAGYVKLGGTVTSPEIDTRFAVIDALFNRTTPSTVGVWMHADEKGASGGTMFCRREQPILTGTFDLPLHLDFSHLASGGKLLRDGPVRASLKGKNVPVEQLVPTPLVEEWITETSGYLQVDLEVGGTWERLEPRGRIGLEEGAVTLVDFGRRFENIQVSTQFSRERIALEKLSLEDNSRGEVQADGAVELANFVPKTFDFNIQTKTFNVGGFASDFAALVTSKVDVDGEVGDPHRVDVEVAKLDVELPENQKSGTHPTGMSSDIIVVERRGGSETSRIDEYLASGSTGTSAMNARVHIQVGDDSYVRHPNGFLRFSADLRARIQGTRFSLTGNVDSIKGDFEFLGRDFRVDRKEGIVRLSGAQPPNPQLDIVAIHPLDRTVVAQLDPPMQENPKVFVRVTGTARDPKLELTSEPAMSESEIIFVLMTGRPPSSAAAGQEEGVASQAAAAAGGIFSAMLQQKISKTVPVDVFRFESGESGLQGSKVRVGKYITSELFVSSAYQFAEDEQQGGWETRVEYHFLPRWMVEAVYGEHQTGALNVFWDIY